MLKIVFLELILQEAFVIFYGKEIIKVMCSVTNHINGK